MQRVTLYFDMRDLCVGVDFGGVGVLDGQVVDSGIYILPYNFNPIGMSASQLFSFGLMTYRKPLTADIE